MDDVAGRREDIRKLMEYAVPEERLPEALDLLEIYRHDRLALDLLHEFYSFLPEARNDWIREIRLVARRQGILLLAAMTGDGGYLYLVSSEGLEFQGLLAEGLWDLKLLDFFGFAGRDDCQQLCGSPEELSIYAPLDGDRDVCPACHAASGELHELGCPVELCPWCGGQLINCSCRFDKLELDHLAGEHDLVRFEEILNEQGRIPYSPEQRPSFADDGSGVILD